MKIRQDAWTDENDLLLAETVLRHVREGSTQLNAFEEVGDKLNRTSAACGFRWNAVVRHNYEKALQLAKKQRKQRQRILGKEQSGKKKLLYSPPEPILTEMETVENLEIPAEVFHHEISEELTNIPEQPVASTPAQAGAKLNLNTVIAYLQSINHSNLHADILKSENERLKREIADLKNQNKELQDKLDNIEENATSMQEDYETLMKIMNKARKLALFEEEERSTTKFKMDRNGNLEKVAE